MKLTFTQCVLLCSLFILSSISSTAQPDYIFKSAVLKSGTDLQPGAVYKFSNVKNNVDANVTILAVTGGVSLYSIDENWTGFDEAFQPFINVSPLANGYVEFKVDFVQAGTENLRVQGNVPVTCIDVDGVQYGNGTLYEQDQVQFVNGYYDFSMTGLNLQVLNPVGWISMKNTSGFSYDGIDTSQHDVMATVINNGVSGFKIRIGALNTSPTISEVRYRSVYFKRFNYTNSILLPNRTTIRFSGNAKGTGVELKGALSASHTYDRMIIERSTDGAAMMAIAEIPLAGTNSSEYPFTYFDNTTNGPVYYYRVRLVNTLQRIQEASNTIIVKLNGAADNKDIKLVNTLVNSGNPVLAIQSKTEDEVNIQLADMSGRIVLKNTIRLYNGTNSISLPGFAAMQGYYVVMITSRNNTVNQKILVQ